MEESSNEVLQEIRSSLQELCEHGRVEREMTLNAAKLRQEAVSLHRRGLRVGIVLTVFLIGYLLYIRL
jgi:hypothetical protein